VLPEGPAHLRSWLTLQGVREAKDAPSAARSSPPGPGACHAFEGRGFAPLLSRTSLEPLRSTNEKSPERSSRIKCSASHVRREHTSTQALSARSLMSRRTQTHPIATKKSFPGLAHRRIVPNRYTPAKKASTMLVEKHWVLVALLSSRSLALVLGKSHILQYSSFGFPFLLRAASRREKFTSSFPFVRQAAYRTSSAGHGCSGRERREKREEREREREREREKS
jgi:hypothetical protein